MGIADKSGFEAIQGTIPQGPHARRKIVRGADGTPQVVLVDSQSGEPIQDMSGYSIVDTQNYLKPGSMQPGEVQEPKSTPTPSVAKGIIQKASDTDSAGGSTPGSESFGRHQGNNFGYVNKPGMMGLAGALPGPLGMAGKAVNAGINANNVAAVNAARGTLGLEGVGLGKGLLGIAKDNKGQVADVSIGGSQYATPVGLEGLSPDGMTNMTPQEAAARAAATGGLSLSTPEQVAARDAAFEAEFSKPGIFSRIGQTANNFVDSMFGGSTYDPVAHQRSVSQNSGKDFQPTQSGFADMIGNATGSGKAATSKPANNVSGASRSTAGKVKTAGSSDRSGSGIGSGRSNPNTSGNMGAGAGTTSGHGPGIGSA